MAYDQGEDQAEDIDFFELHDALRSVSV